MKAVRFALISACMLISASAFAEGGHPMVEAAEAYATASCECKDVACAQKAAQDYAAKQKELAEAMAKDPMNAKPPTAEDTKKITDAATKAAGCMQKAATPAAP